MQTAPVRLRKRAIAAKFFADRGTHLAAMVAYFALLSFVPLVFLSLALLGLGFWLIHEGQWDYKLWIILALIGFGLAGSAVYIVARKGKDLDLPAQTGMLIRMDNTITVPVAIASNASLTTGSR